MSVTHSNAQVLSGQAQLNNFSAEGNTFAVGDIIPAVSVIMPNFNCEKFILGAVNSVLSQTFTDLELIVVDDCSTDKSVEIVEDIARKDGRVVLLKNSENKGAAFCRNRGVKAARGRYIAFLDSDDLWTEDKLRKQLAFMKEGGYAFSCTSYDHIDRKSVV